MNRIKYGVTVQKAALQYGVFERVHACVHTCAIEIKPGMLRDACFIDVRV